MYENRVTIASASGGSKGATGPCPPTIRVFSKVLFFSRVFRYFWIRNVWIRQWLQPLLPFCYSIRLLQTDRKHYYNGNRCRPQDIAVKWRRLICVNIFLKHHTLQRLCKDNNNNNNIGLLRFGSQRLDYTQTINTFMHTMQIEIKLK